MTHKTITSLSLLSLLALMGCNNQPGIDAPTGSATLAVADDVGALYALNEGLGTISRVDMTTGAVQETELGTTPFRVARLDESRVAVSLRSERTVVILEDNGSGLDEVERIEVGAEPSGIVSDGAGRMFVALATQGEVWEFDAQGAHVETYVVEGQPNWLALRPQGDVLYAASSFGATVTAIDLESGSTETQQMPVMEGLEGDHVDTPVTLTPRITGDLSVSPDGDSLAVPVTYVDNVTPTDPDGDDVPEPESSYSAGAGSVGVTRINPALVTVGTVDDGAMGDSEVFFLAGQVTSNARSSEVVRGYVSSATWHPDGTFLWITMEGSNIVQALLPVARQAVSEYHEDATVTNGEFVAGDRAIFATDAGPRGVAFTADGEAYVHNFIDREIALLGDEAAVKVSGAVLSEDTLPDDIEEGRKLFYASTGAIMSADGSGMSCATCHLQGRNDGLTWNLEQGLRQTPSLGGEVGHTAPFTWIDGVDSVQDEAMHTSEVRMGGAGLTQAEADAIAAFVDFTPGPDVPDLQDADSVARGAELFFSSEVGCGSCHFGDDYTDHESHDMFGLEGVNTPRLKGIAASAPYLHDGSAETIMDVLEDVRDGEMGDTSGLTDEQMKDLEAFVLSL